MTEERAKAEAVALPVYVQTAPERIYLQVADDEYYADNPFPHSSDVSWCSDSVMALEVKYVRDDIHASVVAALEAEVAELKARVERLASLRESDAAYIKKLDGIIEETGVDPVSCINPYEDLKGVVLSLKKDADRYRRLRRFPNNVREVLYADCNLLKREQYLDEAIDSLAGATHDP